MCHYMCDCRKEQKGKKAYLVHFPALLIHDHAVFAGVFVVQLVIRWIPILHARSTSFKALLACLRITVFFSATIFRG